MKTCITVDVEPDCPPFRSSSHRGVEEGVPQLLQLFEDAGILATFFTTGAVARRFPEMVERIVAAGHELGCHGDSHTRFDQMSWQQADQEICNSSASLRAFYPVTAFRAPNLAFPGRFLPLLRKHGYTVDCSSARYKPWSLVGRDDRIVRQVMTSTTSSILRLPRVIRYPILRRLKPPVVLFLHPWELVDWRSERLRIDVRFRTGTAAAAAMADNLVYLRAHGARFMTIQSLIEE